MDEILSAITVIQLAAIEEKLKDDTLSSDAEIHAYFQSIGLTEAQATRALSYRARYQGARYVSGHSPILAGDFAVRIQKDDN